MREGLAVFEAGIVGTIGLIGLAVFVGGWMTAGEPRETVSLGGLATYLAAWVYGLWRA